MACPCPKQKEEKVHESFLRVCSTAHECRGPIWISKADNSDTPCKKVLELQQLVRVKTYKVACTLVPWCRLAFAALLFIVTCINSTFSLMAPIFPQVPTLVSSAFFQHFRNCRSARARNLTNKSIRGLPDYVFGFYVFRFLRFWPPLCRKQRGEAFPPW